MERLKGDDGRAQEYFDEAIQVATEFEKRDPGNPVVLSYKALALASTGRLKSRDRRTPAPARWALPLSSRPSRRRA